MVYFFFFQGSFIKDFAKICGGRFIKSCWLTVALFNRYNTSLRQGIVRSSVESCIKDGEFMDVQKPFPPLCRLRRSQDDPPTGQQRLSI